MQAPFTCTCTFTALHAPRPARNRRPEDWLERVGLAGAGSCESHAGFDDKGPVRFGTQDHGRGHGHDRDRDTHLTWIVPFHSIPSQPAVASSIPWSQAPPSALNLLIPAKLLSKTCRNIRSSTPPRPHPRPLHACPCTRGLVLGRCTCPGHTLQSASSCAVLCCVCVRCRPVRAALLYTVLAVVPCNTHHPPPCLSSAVYHSTAVSATMAAT